MRGRPSTSAGTRSRLRGFAFIEALMSILLLAGAILTSVSVISRDMGTMTRHRVDFVGQTVVRKRMDFWRLQPLSAISWSGCRAFPDPDPDLANLPFGQGEECAEDFDARLRKLTVITRVFEQPTAATNPNIREWRATMLVYQDGVNQQLGQ